MLNKKLTKMKTKIGVGRWPNACSMYCMLESIRMKLFLKKGEVTTWRGSPILMDKRIPMDTELATVVSHFRELVSFLAFLDT
jgi:hypothetical protein